MKENLKKMDGEASIRLPGKINKSYPYLANVLSEKTFLDLMQLKVKRYLMKVLI